MTETNKLLAKGELFEIVVRYNKIEKDGNTTFEPIIKRYMICPAPFSKFEELTKLIEDFSNISNVESNSGSDVGESLSAMTDPKVRNAAIEIVKISLLKSDPDVTDEEIADNFTLALIARVIKIAMSINDFLSEMQAMKQLQQEPIKNI